MFSSSRKFVLIKGILARASTAGCVCFEGYAKQLMFISASISWASFFTYFSRKQFSHFFPFQRIFSSISIYRPSTTSEAVRSSSDYDFVKAELIGRDKADGGCEKVFHQCKQSIMEIFTEVYESSLGF